jgi:hypothetical protein
MPPARGITGSEDEAVAYDTIGGAVMAGTG